ncbi:hypothetical protein BH10ACT11_BH10ACT11_02690 [soil metagenome]
MSSLSQGRGAAWPRWLAAICLFGSLVLLIGMGGAAAEAKTKCTQKGTKGVDILKGTKHRDVLCGLGGADILLGKKGNDTLKGGTGKDVLIGGDGADKLLGAGGADSLPGGKGSDKITGKGGSDTAAFTDAPGAMTINLAAQTANGIGTDKLSGIENVIGSPANDLITGNGKPNKFTAGGGDDMLIGGGENDQLIGESGIDTVSYASSPAGVSGGLDSGSMSGDGADTVTGIEKIIGSSHDDTIVGGPDNDQIFGGAGNDHLSGGGGDDLINGDEGNDQIFGEDANDSLHGDAGDDLIDGGAGINACDGGTGANTFAGNCDTGPPTLDDLRIAPASVDTFSSQQTIVFRIDAEDDLAGLDAENSQVIIHTPSGVTKTVSLALISGTTQQGTLGADFVLPRYAAEGTYTFDVVLADKSGNKGTTLSSELIAAAHPGSFEQTGEGDSEAPKPTGLTMSPPSVDTSTGSQTLHFTVKATDDLAGIDAGQSYVDVITPAGKEQAYTYLSLTSGTATDGTLTGDAILPRYSAQGTYTLELLLVDQAGNEDLVSSSVLIGKGFTGSFQQTGVGDTTGPLLGSFTRSPATTDTREGSQTLSISITATDNLSGVDAANSRVVVRDPNGVIDSSTPLTDKGGNVYTAAPTLARGAAPGIWKIDLVLYDKALNASEFSSSQLSQLGFQSTFQNLAVQGT